MDVQTVISIVILTGALIYTFIRFRKNWKQGDTDPKCENCNVKDKVQSLKLKDKS